MNKHVAAAAALVLVCACGRGYTNGTTGPFDGSIPPTGNNIADGGDAGADAGDAGHDGGSDGGCVAASLSGVEVIDGCFGSQAGVASVSVSAQNCVALITMDTPTGQCTGTADGGSNAFRGACGGFSTCLSSSLPGTILCNNGTSCAIVICDGSCGP